MHPKEISATQVNRICQILKTVTEFRAPEAGCLSPAGEYNLRLGIQQHYQPDHLFTSTSKADAVDGHPFLVEVGVAFGGETKTGKQDEKRTPFLLLLTIAALLLQVNAAKK